MGFVVRRVENRTGFFDLLRCIVVLRNEKDRKICRFPIVAVEGAITRQPPRLDCSVIQ